MDYSFADIIAAESTDRPQPATPRPEPAPVIEAPQRAPRDKEPEQPRPAAVPVPTTTIAVQPEAAPAQTIERLVPWLFDLNDDGLPVYLAGQYRMRIMAAVAAQDMDRGPKLCRSFLRSITKLRYAIREHYLDTGEDYCSKAFCDAMVELTQGYEPLVV